MVIICWIFIHQNNKYNHVIFIIYNETKTFTADTTTTTTAAAIISILSIYETKYEACEVEQIGLVTSGQTVFDRRPNSVWRRNMEVFYKLTDPEAIRIKLLKDLYDVDRRLSWRRFSDKDIHEKR